MSEEYEIIFVIEKGRAIKNNKTGKIYYSEFEIIEEKNKEIERLNNIINELEKWIKEDNICFETQFYMGRCVNFQCILDKLQELKGSGSNGN